MKKVSSYELAILFDTNKELSKEESSELSNTMSELFKSSSVFSIRLDPIIEE